MKVSCGHCSELHDISQMEPSHAMPDCIAAMSKGERDTYNVIVSKDICAIKSTKRGFLRLLLPIPVEGEGPCNWGVWVELYSYADFMGAVDAWTDESLLKKTCAGKLANELLSYPGSLGLSGTVSFTDVKSIGRFDPAGFPHAEMATGRADLIRDYYQGVTAARKLEWLLPLFHSNEPAS